MSHFVYILKCADKTLYTGSCLDPVARIYEHNHTSRGAKYTRGRRPVKLVYLEECATMSVARSKEAKYKKLARDEKIKLISGYHELPCKPAKN
ncbi:MAG: GIY-YIG nuclease family protein [Patescibacteria group bacterium]